MNLSNYQILMECICNIPGIILPLMCLNGRYRSNLLLSQSEVVNVRAEKERVKADGLKTIEGLEQRLQHTEILNEVTKREHHSMVTQLHNDSQLLATLHRVILFLN